MRLRSDKVEFLSQKIAAALKRLKRLEMTVPPEQVAAAVKRVIIEDLRREDELEKEAEAILKQYQLRIHMQNLSYNTLVAKTKQELAKKKRIVL
jgi:hypothetical protein